ncbi:MAG: LysR family transcriptional regulator [Acinetobacter populi]|jgi:DNA-binding transcriptional LysR family regulator|uniref:LysR family transcriptional regulator n=1 Tax=Acinetobacter populi TaxID=1582270 RepID=UPI0023560064|nr:LysR family transcriptional regulator [Acinetobacter populi]MCH4248010.1 LysR family transcriptional regulator [Acinetobacter populi]
MSRYLHSNLQSILAFVHTVETGSFTAAALRIGISKSSVGKHISRLEERLGIRLFERTTRTMNLTTEGKFYYQSCLNVLDELSSIETLLASRMQEVSGLLRINMPLSFGRLHVMPVLKEVVRNNPKLDLDISFTDRQIDLVEEGIDLVIRLGKLGNYSNLIGRQIGIQRSVICASPEYLKLHGIPSNIEDLEKHICLGFSKNGRPLPWLVIDTDNTVKTIKIQPRYIISHGEALKDATVNGMGIAYLSTWLVADDIYNHRLEVIPIPTPLEDTPITILWPKTKNLAPKIRVIVDALIEAFMPIPKWDIPFLDMK